MLKPLAVPTSATRATVEALQLTDKSQQMGNDDSMSKSTFLADGLQGKFVIPASAAQQLLASKHSLNDAELHGYLLSLVEPASALARPSISKFHVGAVGLGASGAVYVGVNLEFPGGHLNNSIHAEQCLLLNCLLHGETGIRVLAVSEAPCGHCRQFYAELSNSDDVRFVFGAGSHWQEHHRHSSQGGAGSTGGCKPAIPRPPATYSLDQLLPAKFGPSDLMSEEEVFPLLLQPQNNRVELVPGSVTEDGTAAGIWRVQAAHLAEQWACKCYCPYTKSASGAAILVKDGNMYGGGYVESAAYNPSLTPFHAAWVAAVVHHVKGFHEIEEVIIAELPDAPVQHKAGIAALLAAISPAANLTVLPLQRITTNGHTLPL